MNYYVYVLLDTRKPGVYQYGSYTFAYEPFYVGKGTGKRWKSHMSEALRVKVGSHKDNKIRKIIAETGDLPGVAIASENLDEAEAFSLERSMIVLLGRADLGKGPLTNKSAGGEGQTGYVHTEATKALLRTITAENVQKYGNGFAGKHHTEEAKAKKREASKRAWGDPEKRAKQSKRNSGEGNPMYGRKRSDEERRKISQSKKRRFAENPEELVALRKRLSELNERLGPAWKRVTEQGRRNQGAASRKRWEDPETRKRMEGAAAKTWEVTSPTGEVVIVTSLRKYMLGLGFPTSASGNLAFYGKWRGWKARKVE